MDKPPLPILTRWIFEPLGRVNSRPLSGFVYHKFRQNFWLGPPEVAIQQSKGRAKPTQDSSMSKQTTKPLFFGANSFMKTMTSMSNSYFPQLWYFYYPFAIILNTDLGLIGHFLLICAKLYFSLIILCQVNKFRKSPMVMAWVKKTRNHWVSNKELQCSHWNIKP